MNTSGVNMLFNELNKQELNEKSKAMKETKIEIPAGCEVERIETQDGAVVVTFKEAQPKLPKSWEEFCEMFPVKKGECYFSCYSTVTQYTNDFDIRAVEEKMTLPDRATAEAVLALCQLIQLRECYNGDWVPDWTDQSRIYMIEFDKGFIIPEWDYNVAVSPLYFKSEELRDEFLRNFRPLIEKLRPLYGIKEGGEQ